MSITRTRRNAAWQVLSRISLVLVGIVPAIALAGSPAKEDSTIGTQPRRIRVDANCRAALGPDGPAGPTEDALGNQSELSAEFEQEVRKVLRELDSSQLSMSLRILPAALLTSGVESRITDRLGRNQTPVELGDLSTAGRVCRIVRVGAESTMGGIAGASEENAVSAPIPEDLKRGYRITAVMDATHSVDPTEFGLPESTKVAAVRLVPVEDQNPRLQKDGKADNRTVPPAEVVIRWAGLETQGHSHSVVGRPAPSAGHSDGEVGRPAPIDVGPEAASLAFAQIGTNSEPARTVVRVRKVGFIQAEPDASDAPDPAAEPSTDNNADTADVLADDAADSSGETSAPMMLDDLDFPSIGDITVDILPKRDPSVTEERLQQPETHGPEVFLAHGEELDIPRVGNVGLDEAIFLESAAFCHQPLYFEEANLERYGNSYCRILQPVLSGYRFFASVPATPYMMAAYRPRKCYYDTSPYLPGRAAPRHDESLPVSLGASATEGAAITALIFMFPP